MYKKVTSKYVVIAKNYQQTRGNNLTFFVGKPCNYQKNGKLTSLRGNLAKPVVARVLSVSVKNLTRLRGNPKTQ